MNKFPQQKCIFFVVDWAEVGESVGSLSPAASVAQLLGISVAGNCARKMQIKLCIISQSLSSDSVACI